jgi:hypothetical protein
MNFDFAAGAEKSQLKSPVLAGTSLLRSTFGRSNSNQARRDLIGSEMQEVPHLVIVECANQCRRQAECHRLQYQTFGGKPGFDVDIAPTSQSRMQYSTATPLSWDGDGNVVALALWSISHLLDGFPRSNAHALAASRKSRAISSGQEAYGLTL